MSQELQKPQSPSEEQKPQSPLTYGDVFPAMGFEGGAVASEPITIEDASLMQTAEAMAFGKTQKGGAASAMQSAAEKNVQDGFVERDAHSTVAEQGLSVTETSVPGAIMDIAYVAGLPVSGSARPTPTDPAIAALDAVTIGEALEAAAVGAGDRPLNENDARAILSAEARATGIAMPMKGGIGASAQSAAQFNLHTDGTGNVTLADVLMDATADLQADKVVTYEDAFKVMEAELRGRKVEDLQPGGVGASLVAAANLNEQSGLTPPPEIDDDYFGGSSKRTLEGEKKQDVVQEVGNYYPLDTSADAQREDEGTKTPPVSYGSEQLPSGGSGQLPDSSAGEKKAPLVSENSETPLFSHSSDQLASHGSAQLPAPKVVKDEEDEETPLASDGSGQLPNPEEDKEDKTPLSSHGSGQLPNPEEDKEDKTAPSSHGSGQLPTTPKVVEDKKDETPVANHGSQEEVSGPKKTDL